MAVMTAYETDRERYERETPSFTQQLDWIPLVSNITGVVRVVFGLLEVVVGIVTLPFEFVYDLTTNSNHIFLFAHGARNILRGLVAQAFIAGNIALYLYDTSQITKY